MLEKVGINSGFDAIADQPRLAANLNAFLNAMAEENHLPRTIIYNLYAAYNDIVASTIANFQYGEEGGVKSPLQFGSGWWFNDTRRGMLNGSHSFLAYLGYLAGYAHISDCMQDEALVKAAHHLMLQEQAPTLRTQGVDLAAYADALLQRYRNRALKHRTWQIAMDGSQKLPQRMLDSIRWHLAHGSRFDMLELGVAGWMRYVGGVDEQGNTIDISDPLRDVLADVVRNSAQGEARVQALLGLEAIFGQDLPQQREFVTTVTRYYQSLLQHGVKQTLRTLVW